MSPRKREISPPTSWTDFEDLCHHLFKAVWRDPLAQKVGRPGQTQHGVDIFGSPQGHYEVYHGVQCKFKNRSSGGSLTVDELHSELAKADEFTPPLQHWICATTSPNDAALQREARVLSNDRARRAKFTVSVLFWEEIAILLCQHKDVLKAHYPEHSYDLPAILESNRATTDAVRDLVDIVSENLARQSTSHAGKSAVWHPVLFGNGRDLGPALLGRGLGPQDAIGCPRLPETDTAVRELKQAYFSRILGEPGTGKSVCSYQAALHFAEKGWIVYRLADVSADPIELKPSDDGRPALFVIDDAHLANVSALRAAEHAAGPRRFLLSTHNAVKHDASYRGAIIIDGKRAVRTIAAELLRDSRRTLDVVRRIDDQVGELPHHVSLEDRVSHAEFEADLPWQFCFILGGGWRRAKNVADAARVRSADITLAAVALCQLASRDSRPLRSELTALLHSVGLSAHEVHTALDWLLRERVLLARDDLRCPHQRYASALLSSILAGQCDSGRTQIGRMLDATVSNSNYPLSGLRLLMYEISLRSDRHHRWTRLVSERSLNALIERCWEASDPRERMVASLLLSEVGAYVAGWPRRALEGRQNLIGHWISQPEEPSGYGLSHLLHAVYNIDEEFARSVAEAAAPDALANAVSAVTCQTAFNLGHLVSALHHWSDTPWGTLFSDNLDRSKLVLLAVDWPQSEPVWAFAEFCVAIGSFDEQLALDMLDAFMPTAQRRLSKDPVATFADLHDVAFYLLRMLDYFGTYVGRLAPTSRHRKLARTLLHRAPIASISAKLSSVRLRDFRTAALFLTFFERAHPSKFRSIVEAMDWRRIAASIGEQWRDLPRDAEILLEIAHSVTACSDTIVRLIHKHSSRIERFPPSLAAIAPSAALEHADGGGMIRLTKHGHVDWHYGAMVIRCFAQTRPDLLEDSLRASEATTARIFSEPHPSFYQEAEEYVDLLRKAAPTSLQRIFDRIDVDRASEGWPAALRYGKSPRRTAALLVESCVDREDQLGVLAKRLRTRFPRSSVPANP